MRISNLLYLVAGLAIILAAVGVSNSAKAPDSPDAVKIKPDIVVNDLRIDLISATAANHNVRINTTVMNRIRGTGTGAFKVKVEWTENPTAGYNLLAIGGVTNLPYDDSTVVINNAKTLSFTHTVPIGKSYKYRVTADYLNQVEEADETNNIRSAGYTASPAP
jgi:hypothetical protein